ncbi:hypothetical protein BY996DRAFT_6597304 [Phakopsora pachyrhizi]|uniref:Tet-like 2OG-Fe(II) oxygenase domain-containing protein n=1 Tax=Phakopsora pachyrhizi TaxID=170000 RepID=A0AAV0AWH9_PHAPC|nr:hypothetical protein BY996DRAFT_6597304 [Phakopsora pachyrhizi]CAH7674546.1 hypothetical protein PPACK8108_LOCUS9439 [Phakopsora pachyrhizi]
MRFCFILHSDNRLEGVIIHLLDEEEVDGGWQVVRHRDVVGQEQGQLVMTIAGSRDKSRAVGNQKRESQVEGGPISKKQQGNENGTGKRKDTQGICKPAVLAHGIFEDRKFTNKICINSKIKKGSMWPVGLRKVITKLERFGIYGMAKKIKSYKSEWNQRGPLFERMNNVLAGIFKHAANGWFHKVLSVFNGKGLPSFSATLLYKNPAEAFSAALKFTTSDFENTPHLENHSSYLASGWWIHVN